MSVSLNDPVECSGLSRFTNPLRRLHAPAVRASGAEEPLARRSATAAEIARMVVMPRRGGFGRAGPVVVSAALVGLRAVCRFVLGYRPVDLDPAQRDHTADRFTGRRAGLRAR